MFRQIRVFLLSLACVGLSVSQAWACPMCKLALETDDPQPRAYMYSILFMMGMIASIFAGMIGFLYWLSRNERAALDAAGYQHLFENGVSQSAANPTA
jgi:hypothetical protein